jgi:hypothetical protein
MTDIQYIVFGFIAFYIAKKSGREREHPVMYQILWRGMQRRSEKVLKQ